MFRNKKIFILGFALSGYSTAKVVAKDNEVVINDLNKNEDKEKVKELEKLGVKVVLGSHPDDLFDDSFDYLIKNPGVPLDHKYIKMAEKYKIPVINELELGYRLLDKKVHLIGITGSNGKTTTTTMIYDLLKLKYKDKVHLAGNIGYPLVNMLDDIKEGDYLVIETSCQQLTNLDKYHPEVAVLTNIFPAHLDFFKIYSDPYLAYTKDKIKIFKEQTKDDIAVINLGNDRSVKFTKDIKSNKLYFGREDNKAKTYLKDNIIYYDNKKFIDTKDIFLKGEHNYENIMAALVVVKHYKVDDKIIIDYLKTFKGVPHRLEYITKIGDLTYYNDTEATNIDSTIKALKSFDEDICLFLGGLDRGQDFTLLKPYMKHVKEVITIGSARERVKEELKEFKPKSYEHLKDAFKNISLKKGIVLLSPASASWDQYKRCEVRGDEFKELVYKQKLNK